MRNKNYVSIKDMRAYYDERIDSTVLISSDKSINTNGFRVILKQDSAEDRTIREKLGLPIVSESLKRYMSTFETHHHDKSTTPSRIPLGSGIHRKLIQWDTDIHPNVLFVDGDVGKGKTVLLDDIERHLKKCYNWQVPARNSSLEQIEQETKKRLDNLMSGHTKFKRTMFFLGRTPMHRSETVVEEDVLRENVEVFHRMHALWKSVGIHVIVDTAQPLLPLLRNNSGSDYADSLTRFSPATLTVNTGDFDYTGIVDEAQSRNIGTSRRMGHAVFSPGEHKDAVLLKMFAPSEEYLRSR